MEQHTLNQNDYSDKFEPLYRQYVKLRYLTIIPVLLFAGIFFKIIPISFYKIAVISLFVMAFINWLYPYIILQCPKCKGKLYPTGIPSFWIRFHNGKYCPNCGAKLLK